MNVLLKGHVTICASIIQALLNVFATKDTFFLASHIVAVSVYKRIAGILFGILFLWSQHEKEMCISNSVLQIFQIICLSVFRVVWSRSLNLYTLDYSLKQLFFLTFTGKQLWVLEQIVAFHTWVLRVGFCRSCLQSTVGNTNYGM